MGLPLFCHHRFQRLDVERLLGDDVLEPAILVLELLHALQFAQLHAAVLRFPAVVRLLGDPVRATQVGHLPTSFAFLDDRQDLLVAEFAPFHRSSSERRTSSYPWRIRGGRSIPVTLEAGQTFYEWLDDVHVVGLNASQTAPAKFLVSLVKDKGAPLLTPVN